jgi:Ribbon-helix-helix protein, copG family
MVRTQIQLTEEQAAKLKELSSSRHVSIAEIIRQAVDLAVKSSGGDSVDRQRERAAEAAGKFHSGVKDLSAQHDRYLAEAFKK